MAGNSIGQLFRVTTCGESHGVGLMAIVDGVPPGIELSAEDLQKDLDVLKTKNIPVDVVFEQGPKMLGL